MFNNFLKVALRTITRHKTFSLINLLGLSFGITCGFLLMIYVFNELSYDKHYSNADRVYRIGAKYKIGGRISEFANIGRPIGPNLKNDFPEVEEYLRFVKYNRLSGNPVLIKDINNVEKEIEEPLVFFADSTLFDVFSYKLLKGNPKTALTKKNKVVITENISKKLFGDENPLGRIIKFDNNEECEITGVIEDIPETTHLKFEVAISWATFHTDADLERWIGGHVYTYLLFSKNYNIDDFYAKWPDFFNRHMKSTFDQFNASCDIIIQPITDIYLHSKLQWEVADNGNIIYVYVLIIVGAFILVIACFNYINMTTARAGSRAKEIGIRKVIGANKKALIRQFLFESIIMVIISIFISIVFTQLLLPFFNRLAGKQLSFNLINNSEFILGIIAIGLLVSFLSGIYPSLYLASLIPVEVLKNKSNKIPRKFSFRQLLVVLQFTISIVIIISTGIVNDQLQFVKNKNLGFDKESVVAINIRDGHIQRNLKAVKEELLKNPGIIKAASSQNIPGKDLNKTALAVQNKAGELENREFQFMEIDYDYVDLMRLKILEGRNFDESITTDKTSSILINEATVKLFGWENPVGKEMIAGNDKFKIIGVVNDFHVESLHNLISPVVLFLSNPEGGWLFFKLSNDNFQQSMNFVKTKWSELNSQFPFTYSFIDDNLKNQYSNDDKLGNIFRYSAVVAIFISCLGLLGLSIFTAEQKIKNVAVRKVLGASIPNIIIVLSKELFKLLIVANILAFPIAYYFADDRLNDFAYRIDIGPGNFILASVLSIIVALATVAFQTIKSAKSKPANLLRYE